LLAKKCVDPRQPRSDDALVRIFNEALKVFKEQHNIKEGYEQNRRSIQYMIIMANELGLIFKNNKLTPWGRVLEFLTPEQVPMEPTDEARIFLLNCFLLENYAMIRSLYDHVSRFSDIHDDASWYKETTAIPHGRELLNRAFSVYLHAIRIAVDSVDRMTIKRRYLKLYRQALKTGKTAKALYPKIKPALGIMEDLDLIEERKQVDGKIVYLQANGHKPYPEIMTSFSSYKTVLSKERESLLSTLIEAYGHLRTKTLTRKEIISSVEDFYKKLSDPTFGVCDVNTLIDVTVIKKGLQGFCLSELEVKEAIIEASKMDQYKYQMLSDRLGNYRFIKIKL
jgi:hypothetical protein